MKKYFQQSLFLAAVIALAAGCTSAPSKFYTLNATATGDGASAAQYAIAVGPVTVPAEVDRPQFTVTVAPNRVEVDEFNRWAGPLNDGIARVVAADLGALLGTPRVTSTAPAGFTPDYRVAIDIQKFASLPGQSAQLDAVWVVRQTTGNATLSGRTTATEPVNGDGFDALAAAHSRALAKLSSDLAAAIRSEAGTK